ncbi:MAG: T9SS type A sorting domain-containing protein [bacterium]|nr:T9SS type A sorting domain-containing protein [bacterium]
MLRSLSYLFLLLMVPAFSLVAQVPVMNPIQGASVVCSPPASAKCYTASASNNPLSFSWIVLPANGVVILNPTSDTTSIIFPNTNLTYTVFCMAINSSGTSSLVSMPVKVYETPTVTFSGLTNVCQGSPTVLMASPTLISGSSTLNYLWTPSTGLNATTTRSVIATPPATTTYTLLLTLGSCTNSAKITLNISNCVGIEQLHSFNNGSGRVYPNPNNGNFVYSGPQTGTALIINQFGQKVREISLSDQSETTITNLTEGIYYLITSREKIKIVVINK